MKIPFGEFREWHDTAWPKGYIWSGETLMPDGRDIYGDSSGLNPEISDADIVDLSLFEGLEFEERSADGLLELSVISLVRKWRKARSESPVVVIVPNDQMPAFLALCKDHKWKTK